MIATSATVAAATPISGDRQPRVTPTASTIVRASTISTALARKAPRNRKTSLIARTDHARARATSQGVTCGSAHEFAVERVELETAPGKQIVMEGGEGARLEAGRELGLLLGDLI